MSRNRSAVGKAAGTYTEFADFCAILSDEISYLILVSLADGARQASEIAAQTRIAPGVLKSHLKLLIGRALIEEAGQGEALRYSLSPGVRVNKSNDAVELELVTTSGCRISVKMP
jgi:DNA-binding HxlR family transcriptional regulator